MKKANTYRLSEELDRLITETAKEQGISKNSVVQIYLLKILRRRGEEQCQPLVNSP